MKRRGGGECQAKAHAAGQPVRPLGLQKKDKTMKMTPHSLCSTMFYHQMHPESHISTPPTCPHVRRLAASVCRSPEDELFSRAWISPEAFLLLEQ
ncbi:hypothetical protein EYF80_043503 [Liparis tanakae]|uniref:Uncharacterized protein n=1 Tax=Liparis tanakae TaxID=230148 RepID=A0A4Z2FZP2_9TELE|nr:hypothetical protein EYF80_043503 [Liparis tanakae]